MNLSHLVTAIPFVGLNYASKLKKLEVSTIADLLYHIPSRYVDYRHSSQISNLKAGETTTITGQITSIQNIYTKKGKLMQVASFSDGENKINIIWFNQPFLTRALPAQTQVSISGKVSFWQKKLVIFSPQYEKLNSTGDTIHTGGLIPIYPETAGVSSKWIRSRINFLIPKLENLVEEYLNKAILTDYNLIDLSLAFKKIHQPSSLGDIELARHRLAFDELLQLQVENSLKRITWEKYSQALPINIDKEKIKNFIKNLPFKLTKSQTKTIKEILMDLEKSIPMNRLLEGDVGSGKTVVATVAIYAAHCSNHRSVVMSPTQILATQHYQTLKALLSPSNIKVRLITSGAQKQEKHEADVLIGTHALLEKSINFDKVALIVIDEQHKFGVKQRGLLAKKAAKRKSAPNILTMTATPIPRTIALTLYGDLELSTLNELPKGRKKIATWIIPEKKRDAAYKWIKSEAKKGSQVFVVCPLIEESESPLLAEVKSVKKEYGLIKEVFPQLSIGLLHGKLKPKDKNKAIEDFQKGKFDILVTTPVVEVGIDIPNATIMLIETADRYGLAQLHQLRGRVGRGTKKSYCLLFTLNKGQKVKERLSALSKISSGKALAELDLALRGVGEIFGVKQHGVGELKIARWQDIALMKSSKKLATEIVEKQQNYKDILNYYKAKQISPN